LNLVGAAAVVVIILVAAVATVVVAAEQEEICIHNLYYPVNSNHLLLVKHNL
jgi:predicted nicotinamide N-methyase